MSQLFLKTKTAGYYMVQNANQALYSQLFSNAAWVKTNITLTATQTDPSAGTEAFTLTAGAANATMLQSVALDGPKNRTFTLFLKRKTGTGDISITVDGATYSVEATSGAWARFDTTLLCSGIVTCGIKITTSGDEVYAAWADLSDGVPTWATATTHFTNTANRYTVEQITDADYPSNTARGCAYLAEFFFVMDEATGDIAQSGRSTAETWASADFIGTDIEPDQGVYIAKLANYIVAFKRYSTEFFYNAGVTPGSILAPVQNAAFKVGCASDGSVREMAGTIVWMGQSKDGFGRGIFRLNGMAPEKISTGQIDKILNADSLATVYSWSCNVGSHLLYGLTLVTTGVTLVYDFTTQLWSFFTYLTSSGVTKTVTAVTTAGVATSAAHGYSDGDIVLIAATNASFNGWHVVTDPTTDTFQLQATGTVFSGSGTSVKHTESYFPVIASTSANGKQYMQHATSGALYEFSQSTYIDPIGAIAARIRTPKMDDASTRYKTMPSAELIGDKVSSVAVMRYSDDDYVTYTGFRPVDLSADQSQIRRLGKFRRRSFEVLHVKNALLRLEAIEIEGS